MRKSIITLALLFAAVATSFAQLSIGFGYRGELHDFKDSKDSNKELYDLHGAYLGVSYNICFNGDEDGFGIAPGAYFAFAGDINNNIFTRHTSVELPVYLTYSLEAGPGIFSVYAGPAFNVGINFKQKWIGEGAYEGTPVDWYKKDTEILPLYLSRFDLKAGIGLGYRWEHLQFNVGWDFGVLNRYNKDVRKLAPGATYRIHAWKVGLAYVF